MRRRALLSASAAAMSMSVLGGCGAAARQQISDRLTIDVATLVFHPALKPWIVDGLDANSQRRRHAEILTKTPPTDAALFADAYPTKDRTYDDRVRNANYETTFFLLFEAKVPVTDTYEFLPAIAHSEAWTGWRTARTPLVVESRERSSLGVQSATEVVIATMLARYDADATPSEAVVPLYDEETGTRVGELTARPRFQS